MIQRPVQQVLDQTLTDLEREIASGESVLFAPKETNRPFLSVNFVITLYGLFPSPTDRHFIPPPPPCESLPASRNRLGWLFEIAAGFKRFIDSLWLRILFG